MPFLTGQKNPSNGEGNKDGDSSNAHLSMDADIVFMDDGARTVRYELLINEMLVIDDLE